MCIVDQPRLEPNISLKRKSIKIIHFTKVNKYRAVNFSPKHFYQVFSLLDILNHNFFFFKEREKRMEICRKYVEIRKYYIVSWDRSFFYICSNKRVYFSSDDKFNFRYDFGYDEKKKKNEEFVFVWYIYIRK